MRSNKGAKEQLAVETVEGVRGDTLGEGEGSSGAVERRGTHTEHPSLGGGAGRQAESGGHPTPGARFLVALDCKFQT